MAREEITALELVAVFRDGPECMSQGAVIGRGRFESELEAMGFTKQQLKRMVARGVLRRIITKPDGKAWRATYVFDVDKAS